MVSAGMAVRRELEKIVGTPNHVFNVDGYKVHCWWVATKGSRAGDRNCLLVAADRAAESDCPVLWAVRNGTIKRRSWQKGKPNLVPSNMELANTICVWIKYVGEE